MLDEIMFEAEEKMEKAMEGAKEDLAGIRTCLIYTSRCV